MLSWQVGRVKITRIVEMDLPVPARVIKQATAAELRKSAWLYPHFVSEDGATLKLSIHALLVEAPGLKLIVDTCVGNDRPREITGDQPLATPFLLHLGEAALLEAIAAAGARGDAERRATGQRLAALTPKT